MINYYLLTKPGIVLGNLIPFAAGFLLAARGKFSVSLFVMTLLGLAFVMASGCVFNNYIDRFLDQKMDRTKNRALASGQIKISYALTLGSILLIVGLGLLFYWTNTITVILASIGFIVYVLLYSMWKGKTVYGTAIGSISGAIPPVVGYCAVSNEFDIAAAILFLMMVFWQMPHFFAIAIFHFDDYRKGGIPVLPIVRGFEITQKRMILYIIAFLVSASSLYFFNYTGYFYLLSSFCLSIGWLYVCLKKDEYKQNIGRWGKQMFYFSLIVIGIFCIIPFDIK